MSASLVGSEMCIRDSPRPQWQARAGTPRATKSQNRDRGATAVAASNLIVRAVVWKAPPVY
eukprot:3736133-Alexandrium_andersonii.AAC.1